MTSNVFSRTLVVLDTDECGLDAFDRFLAAERSDEVDVRLLVRAASGSEQDIAAARSLLTEATKLAQRSRFTEVGWGIVLNARDLDAELANTMVFDDAVIIMPEASWPVSQSARLRRSAKHYGALVRFDCITK